MTTCLGKRCKFGSPCLSFVNCCQLMYSVLLFWYSGRDMESDCIGHWQLLIFLLLLTFQKTFIRRYGLLFYAQADEQNFLLAYCLKNQWYEQRNIM